MSRLTTHQLGTLEAAAVDYEWVLMAHCVRVARGLAKLGMLEEDDSGHRSPNYYRITEVGKIALDIERTKIENAS